MPASVLHAMVAWGCLLSAIEASGPEQLRVEYMENPVGIDITQPRLSWVIPLETWNQHQEAYQILVASSPEMLANDEGDLWDSGRAESDRNAHIVYDGAPLQSNQRAYWKVRYWNTAVETGYWNAEVQTSPWSAPAHFMMGLLEEADWTGDWIGMTRPETPPVEAREEYLLDGLNWIWYSDANTEQRTGRDPRFFRRAFDLPDAEITRARVLITVDDRYTVFVNEQKAGKDERWNRARAYDIADILRPGERNVVAVQAVNDDAPGPGGLVARIIIDLADGTEMRMPSDSEWKVLPHGVGGWNTPGLDDSDWPEARILGEVGMQPWGIPYTEPADTTQHEPSPLYRKGFHIEKEVVEATVNIVGLGFYELHLNGAKVGDRVLEPTFTRYDKRVLYSSYDITEQLAVGDHAFGVMLGHGWYDMHAYSEWDFEFAPWRDAPKFLMETRIHYADGETQRIVSDASWTTAPGPIVYDNIRVGEIYDARLEQPGWDQPGFDDSDWSQATEVAAPEGALRGQRSEPIRVTQRIQPVSVTEVAPGVFVFDFGQNLTGWTELNVEGPEGTTIRMHHCERLGEDGYVDEHNDIYMYSGDFATSIYTLKGEGVETWRPRFTYYGFQYVQMEGYPGTPTADTLTAEVVHTDFKSAGSFESSNELLNRIHEATRWAYIGNYVGYPLDCPHREKNGWTGDAHLAANQGLYNYHSAAAYTRWLDDFVDEQQENSGFAGIIPTSGWGYGIGPAWDSAYILIPWYLYQHHGDTRVLEEHYDSMKQYVDYLIGRAEDHIVDYGLGDWVPADTETPRAVTSTAYYYVDTRIIAKTAAILGYEEDAAHYGALADEIQEAYLDHFLDSETGVVSNGSQTAQSTVLYQGLAPEESVDDILAVLVDRVQERDGHLDCGILGTKYLLHALTDNGRADLAYTIATRTTYPSWGHWLEQGATTLWEHWDGTMSRNHVMFGDINAWFFQALAGIRHDPEEPGFRSIIIAPQFVGDLTSVKAEVETLQGTIRSAWRDISYGRGEYFELELTIPANSRATVKVPEGAQFTSFAHLEYEPGYNPMWVNFWEPDSPTETALEPGHYIIRFQIGGEEDGS